MQYLGHEGGTMRQEARIFVLPLCTRTSWSGFGHMVIRSIDASYTGSLDPERSFAW
jgi:hypothetical protein